MTRKWEKSGFKVVKAITQALGSLLVTIFVLGTIGCGKSPTPDNTSAEPSETPPGIPLPDPSSTPQVSATPAPRTYPEKVFVVTAFQAVSEIGTHDFPVGTEVNVLKEEGEEYLVERDGVGVQISKSYFSESDPNAIPATSIPTPTNEPKPKTIAEEETVDIIEMEGVPAPIEQTPAPLAEDTITEEAIENPRVEEITQSLREINDQIRNAQTRQGSQDTSTSQSELENLKKKRDQLGKELTTYGKP